MFIIYKRALPGIDSLKDQNLRKGIFCKPQYLVPTYRYLRILYLNLFVIHINYKNNFLINYILNNSRYLILCRYLCLEAYCCFIDKFNHI